MIAAIDLSDVANPGRLVNNHILVEGLQKAVIDAPRDLNILASTIREVLHDDAWLDRYDSHRARRFRYRKEQFLKFITDPLPDGLATTVETLRRFLKDSPEILAGFELAIDRGRGGANNPHGCKGAPEEEINPDIVRVDSDQPPRNRSNEPAAGNSTGYAFRRLARAAAGEEKKVAIAPDRAQELLDKVKAGELSAHRAMIEAGFRHKPTPLDLLRRAWAKTSDEEKAIFRSEIA
jgi:hypothetical protein